MKVVRKSPVYWDAPTDGGGGGGGAAPTPSADPVAPAADEPMGLSAVWTTPEGDDPAGDVPATDPPAGDLPAAETETPAAPEGEPAATPSMITVSAAEFAALLRGEKTATEPEAPAAPSYQDEPLYTPADVTAYAEAKNITEAEAEAEIKQMALIAQRQSRNAMGRVMGGQMQQDIAAFVAQEGYQGRVSVEDILALATAAKVTATDWLDATPQERQRWLEENGDIALGRNLRTGKIQPTLDKLPPRQPTGAVRPPSAPPPPIEGDLSVFTEDEIRSMRRLGLSDEDMKLVAKEM